MTAIYIFRLKFQMNRVIIYLWSFSVRSFLPGILVVWRRPSIFMLSGHCLYSLVRCCTIFSNYLLSLPWQSLSLACHFCIFLNTLQLLLWNSESCKTVKFGSQSQFDTYDEPSTIVWRSSRDLQLDPTVLRGGKEQNSCTLAWHGSAVTPL